MKDRTISQAVLAVIILLALSRPIVATVGVCTYEARGRQTLPLTGNLGGLSAWADNVMVVARNVSDDTQSYNIFQKGSNGSFEQIQSGNLGSGTQMPSSSMVGDYLLTTSESLGPILTYRYDGEAWTYVSNITLTDNADPLGDSFLEYVVALDRENNSIAAIAGRKPSTSKRVPTGNATVVLYERSSSDDSWSAPIAEIDDPTADGTDTSFGSVLVLSGDYLIVGAPSQSIDGISHAGAVYVFKKVDGSLESWEYTQQIKEDPTPVIQNGFGGAISINDDNILVIAAGAAGIVYVYTLDDESGNFTVVQNLTDDELDTAFGAALAQNGDKLYVTDWKAYTHNGTVYTYTYNSDTGLYEAETQVNSSYLDDGDNRFGLQIASGGGGNCFAIIAQDTEKLIEFYCANNVDICGVCGGDNSTCNTTSTTTGQFSADGSVGALGWTMISIFIAAVVAAMIVTVIAVTRSSDQRIQYSGLETGSSAKSYRMTKINRKSLKYTDEEDD